MDEAERDALVDELLERLRAEGAPAGVWLIEIAQVRRALAAADDLLRRMADVITATLGPPPGPG